jgi:hypothetical protein
MDKLDSIVLMHEPVFNSFNQLFVLEQESFRFEAFKKFAIYCYRNNETEPSYIGSFQVVTKSVFKLKNLSRMLSLLFFGELPDEGKKRILGIKWKGKVGQDSEFAMVAFLKIESNPALDKSNFNNPVLKS